MNQISLNENESVLDWLINQLDTDSNISLLPNLILKQK